MSDPAQVNRSLGTIRTELEYLASAGVLSPPQLQSIQAQLPVSSSSFRLSLRVDTYIAAKWPAFYIRGPEICFRRVPVQPGFDSSTSARPKQSRSSFSSQGRCYLLSVEKIRNVLNSVWVFIYPTSVLMFRDNIKVGNILTVPSITSGQVSWLIDLVMQL
jgi:hypothetical protein